jgi:hypothetical protein
MGMQIGDVWFVDATSGDDNATGVDQDHALKTPDEAMTKVVAARNDYILCYGTHTQTASLAIAPSHVHMIGIGGGGMHNEAGRGCVWTCMATDDSIIPAATADFLEIAGFRFDSNATDAVLIDDAGCDDAFFHHNTIYGSTTASVAIRLDIEGARWTINDNIITLCKLPIDLAGANCVVKRNRLVCVPASSKGIVIGASAHYCIIEGNDIILINGTTDIGLTIAASADYTVVKNNNFSSEVDDNISDAGTSTQFFNNLEAGLTGTSGASLGLVVED